MLPALELSENEQRVYDALSREEISIDDVIRKSGLPSSAASVALLSLEMKRLVRQLPRVGKLLQDPFDFLDIDFGQIGACRMISGDRVDPIAGSLMIFYQKAGGVIGVVCRIKHLVDRTEFVAVPAPV